MENKMWRLNTEVPTDPRGKRDTKLSTKISTNLLNKIDQALQCTPQLARWNKISTLDKQNRHLIDWGGLKTSKKNIPPTSYMDGKTRAKTYYERNSHKRKRILTILSLTQMMWTRNLRHKNVF